MSEPDRFLLHFRQKGRDEMFDVVYTHRMVFMLIQSILEWRVVRYVISGGVATVSNFVVLYALTEFAHIWYLLSSIVALAVGFAVSFVMQKFWTFRNKSLERVHVQAPLHIALSLANVGTNVVLLYTFVEYFHMWYMLGQFISAALLACMNYFVYRIIIFPQEHTHATDH